MLVVEAREQRMEDEAASLGLNRVEMRGTALGVVCAGVVLSICTRGAAGSQHSEAGIELSHGSRRRA